MPILNYSTKIDCWKTVGEIQQILAKHNISHSSIKTENQLPVALTFTIMYKNYPLNFILPCNHAGVLGVFKKDKKIPKTSHTQEQALRTAWRIIKDWVASQLAIVESEQTQLQIIFMPWMVNEKGETLAQKMFEGEGYKRLNSSSI